jgi:hypothetical protein
VDVHLAMVIIVKPFPRSPVCIVRRITNEMCRG